MSEFAATSVRTLDDEDTIPEGAVIPHYLNDRKLRVAIARVDGHLYAFDDLCTCDETRCPLSGGLLSGTTIMCQCHGSRFDIPTGAVISGPATDVLAVYEVTEIDGAVQLHI
jgi:3-phenylpropionate/trans-cinnamate dioxygenase ferredoxin component